MPIAVTEAVRLAKEAMGDVSPEELAASIATNFGMPVKPVIVKITLASLREEEELRQRGERALELIAQAQAEQRVNELKRKARKPKDSSPEVA